MNKLRITAMFFLVVSMYGCTAHNLRVMTGYDDSSRLLTQVNTEAKGNKEWFEKSFLQSDKKNIYQGTIPAPIAQYLERGLYFIDDKKTTRNILFILEKLLVAWKGESPKITILIQSLPKFKVETDEHNHIILSSQFLKKVKNDAQLAAILAHELSHILLRHNQNKSIYNSMFWRIEDAAKISQLIVKSQGENFNENNIMYTDSANMLLEDLMSPALSRDYESQADRLGLDLYLNAGYNSEVFFAMLMKLQETRINQGVRLERIAELGKYDLLDDSFKKLNNQSEENLSYENLLMSMASSLLIDSAKDWLAKRNVNYDSPEERQNSVKTYFNKFYDDSNDDEHKDLPPPPPKTVTKKIKRGVWKKDKGINDSVISRSRLKKSKYMPSQKYIKLSEYYLKKGRNKDAEEILSLAHKRIGRQHDFLPLHIQIAMNQNNIKEAEQYTIKCLGDEANLLENLTKKITFQTSFLDQKNELFYQNCVAILGYDPKETKKTSNQTIERTKHALDSVINSFSPSM